MRNSKKNENQIGEILGLLEEKEKNKEWVLDELKRKKIKLKVSPTANSFEILNVSPKKFVSYLYNLLKDDELDIKEVKTLSKTFHWFFIDIVSSADPTMTVKGQARKIRTLNEIIRKQGFSNKEGPNRISFIGQEMEWLLVLAIIQKNHFILQLRFRKSLLNLMNLLQKK